VMIGSIVKGEIVGLDEVYRILDETSQVIEYSHRLEEKSTELEYATTQLQMANDRLKELDSMKDDFLSMISHEFRTPLTSLRAFGEILQDNPNVSPEERKQFLGIIVNESERLTRLIEQLLDLAKMEAGRMDWLLEEVDVPSSIKEALAALNLLLKEQNIDLTLDFPEHIPLIQADRDQLIQVMINLVSNAIKFCDQDNGKINVRVSFEKESLCVTVEDNGEGIPVSLEEKIFDRFHQSQIGGAEKPQGTGLGLAICREIISFLGGKIWAENGKDGGAKFSFTLPVPVKSSPKIRQLT